MSAADVVSTNLGVQAVPSSTAEYPYAPAATREARSRTRTALTMMQWTGDVEEAAETVGFLMHFVLGKLRDEDVQGLKPLTVRLVLFPDELFVEVSGGDSDFPDVGEACQCVPSLRWSRHEDAPGKTLQARLPVGGVA